jgi:hypothetical protein
MEILKASLQMPSKRDIPNKKSCLFKEAAFEND